MKREIFSTMSIKGLSTGLNFLGLAALSNSMNSERYGNFVTIFSGSILLSIIISFGRNFSFLSSYSDIKDSEGLARSEYAAFSKRFARAAFALLLSSLSLIYVYEILEMGEASWMVHLGIAAISLSIIYSYSEICQSVFRIFDGAINSLVFREVIWRMCFFCAALYIFVFKPSEPILSALLILSSSLFFITTLQYLLSRISPLRESARPGLQGVRLKVHGLREQLGFLGVGVLSTAAQYLVILLCASVLDPSGVAHFHVSFKTHQVLALTIFAVNYVIAPRIRAFVADGDREGLSRAAAVCAWINTIFCLLGVAFFLVVGGYILGIFGSEYRADLWLLLLLSAGAVVNGMTGPAGYMLVLLDRQAIFNRISLFTMVGGAVLCVLLGIFNGISGFAVGYVIWNTGQSVIIAYRVYRELGLNSTIFNFSIFRHEGAWGK